ncbi:MAG TPA: hypothetical protein DC047_13495 [Blastocatellia bacterium]|nr:hypothetical protein [Blastocatellia bacterium]
MSSLPHPLKEYDCQRQASEENRGENEIEASKLLQRIAEGDSSAFWKVWETYRQYLYTLCLKQMGGIHTDAEDALSRAMIKALDRLPVHADKIRNLKAWLARLTTNLCIDMHRESRREARGFDNIEEITDAHYDTLSVLIESPEELVLRRETDSYLYRLIKGLPANLFEPFVLHFFQGESYSDIAVQLDLSNDNVRKRIQQARAILREGLTRKDIRLTKPEARRDSANINYPPEPSLRISEVELTEITPPIAIRLVKVTTSAALEMSFEVSLSHRPQQHSRLETLEKYVRNYPRGWKRRWDLACLLFEMGLWDASLHEFRHILERKPRLIDAYLLMGQILHLLERKEEAIAVYERALLMAKKDATRHHLGGMIAVCRGHYETAIGEFQMALQLEPYQAVHRHNLGMVHLRAETHFRALQAFDECLKVNPRDIVALTYSYAPLLSVARKKEAERRLLCALEVDPANVAALRFLTALRSERTLVVSSQESKLTWQWIRRGLRLAPHTAEARESLAIYHIFRGEWATGIRTLRTFTEQHPHYPLGWANLARWLLHTGATEAAAQAIMQGYILQPVDRDMKQIACEVFIEMENQERLHSLLRELLAQYPEHWSVWVTAAHALIRVFKDQDQACAIAALAPRLQPQLAAAWFEHGRVLALCNRHPDALAALEKGWGWLSAKACDKQVVDASILSGKSLRNLGEEERAQWWFERAAQKALVLSNHSPAIAYYLRGQALEALRDPVGAIQAYQASLAHHVLYPWRRAAQRSLKQLQSRIRSPATA